MKKLIAIILAAVMCLSLLPVVSFAAVGTGTYTKIERVEDLTAGTYKMAAKLEKDSDNKDLSAAPYHLTTGAIDGDATNDKNADIVTASYAYGEDGVLTPAGDDTAADVELIATGKDNTYYIKMNGKYLYSAASKNRRLALGDTATEWVASNNSNGGITLTSSGVNLGSASATSKFLRSYANVGTLKYGVVFFAPDEVCEHGEDKTKTTKYDETNHWAVCECGSIVPESQGAHALVNGECGCGYAAPVAPALGKTYKAGVFQGNLGKFLYLTGEMSDRYVVTTENAEEAADVFVEAVGEGWRLFFMDGTTKTYIDIQVTDSAKGYVNVILATEAPVSVYTYNTEYNTFVVTHTTEKYGDDIYFIGGNGTFDTLSSSYKNNLSSYFPLHLYPTTDHEHTLSDLVNNGDAGHSQTCSICGYVNASDHAFEIQQGLNGHYQLCVCGNKGTEEAHADGDDADKLCDKCGADLSCKHEKDWVANKDTTNHWIECPDCGAKDEVETHALTAKKDDAHHWTECECGYATAKVEHTLTAKKDDTHHWTECECGHATDKVAHTLTTKHNDTHHWSECACGYKSAEVAHTLTDNKCSCGYEAEPETSEPVEVPDDVKAILDAAYALEAEAELPYAVELTGKITAINTAYSEQYKNISVTITVPGCEDQPIMCFRLAGEGAKDLTIGDTITVSGTIMNYAGKSVQFKQGCELKSVVKGEEPAPVAPEDPKEIVDAAYELEAGTALPYSATLTGKIVSIDTEWSEQYKNITVTIKVAGCEDKPIMCYRLKGDEAAGLAVGDTITVTGDIKNYNGTVEFDSGCTLDKVVKNNVPATADNTIIAPVALLMALSAAGLAVLTLGKKKFF